MRLTVVSGSEAAKVFRKLGYEFDVQHGSQSFFGMPIRHTDVCWCPVTRNSPKALCGRIARRVRPQLFRVRAVEIHVDEDGQILLTLDAAS